MEYSRLFCFIFWISKVVGICPYSFTLGTNSIKKLKLSPGGRFYCISYCLIFPINVVICSIYLFSHPYTGTVKDHVTIISDVVWTTTVIGLNLNQVFRFHLIKRPVQYILDSGGRRLLVSKCYMAVIASFVSLVVVSCAALAYEVPWYNSHERLYRMLVDWQVECCFSVTVFLLHVFIKYMALNLKYTCNIMNSMVKRNNEFDLRDKKVIENEINQSKSYGSTLTTKNTNIERMNIAHFAVREVTRIRKVIEDLQKYFQVPAMLLTIWTVVIFTSYLLFCFGLHDEDVSIYKYCAMALQMLQILLLVDSQHHYDKAVSNSAFQQHFEFNTLHKSVSVFSSL